MKADGTVVAWPTDSYLPTVPLDLSNVVAIVTTTNRCAALRSDGTVVEWFARTHLTLDVTDVADITGGFEHFLVLKRDGTVWSDGRFPLSQILVGLSNVTCIAAGYSHNLAAVGSGPPFLWAPPLSVTAYSGGPALFKATAVGAMPLFYQWQRNGTNIAGATNTWLFLDEVEFEDAGGELHGRRQQLPGGGTER